MAEFMEDMEILINVRPGGLNLSNEVWEKMIEEHGWDRAERESLEYEDNREMIEARELPEIVIEEVWNGEKELKGPLYWRNDIELRTNENLLEIVRDLGDDAVDGSNKFSDVNDEKTGHHELVIVEVSDDMNPILAEAESGAEYIEESHRIWTGNKDDPREIE